MVFYALNFGPGDRILTSISEYASNYIAFLHMARRINASTSTVYSTRLDMQGRGIDALVRAGIHYYNTEDEVAHFMHALAEIL